MSLACALAVGIALAAWVDLGSLWDRSGVTLGHFGVTSGYVWDQSGHLKATLGNVGVTFGI